MGRDISIHALLAESDARQAGQQQQHHNISIHALLAESDSAVRARAAVVAISIHALLAESDGHGPSGDRIRKRFLSTLSLRRATVKLLLQLTKVLLFLSTLSLRRATAAGRSCYLDNIISIHALLAESDYGNLTGHCSDNNFYPRSPCGERLCVCSTVQNRLLFLSTLSLRRATYGNLTGHCSDNNFYPRSPCGERQTTYFLLSDGMEFLSTLSLRRAT